MLLILATKNKHKIKEFEAFCKDNNLIISILGLEDINFKEEIQETGLTIEENAKIKVKTILPYLKENSINSNGVAGEDTGLISYGITSIFNELKMDPIFDKIVQKASFSKNDIKFWEKMKESGITLLPGIYSKRFGFYEDQKTRNAYIINFLKTAEMILEKNISKKAYFKTVIYFHSNNINFLVEGRVEGKIIDSPVGTSGFGYDPIFYYYPLRKTFAQLNINEKNKISHRGRAIKKLIRMLKLYNMI